MSEEVDQPEERFDQNDGDPYREFNTLPAAAAASEVDPLEQNRSVDIRKYCHRIRGDWARNLKVITVDKDEEESNAVTHEDDSREDERSDDRHDIGVCVLCAYVFACTH